MADFIAELKLRAGAAVPAACNHATPLSYYMNVARSILTHGNSFRRKGDPIQAFVMYYRLGKFINSIIMLHHDYNDPGNSLERANAIRMYDEAIRQLETLKKTILANAAAAGPAPESAAVAGIADSVRTLSITAGAGAAPEFPAPAVVTSAPPPQRMAPTAPDVEYGAAPAAWTHAPAGDSSRPIVITAAEQASYNSSGSVGAGYGVAAAAGGMPAPPVQHHHRPSVSIGLSSTGEDVPSYGMLSKVAFRRGPSGTTYGNGFATAPTPPKPTEAAPPTSGPASPGFVDWAAFGSQQLRPTRIPLELIARFNELAMANTMIGERGIETCGVLAGSVVSSGPDGADERLEVSHLILPRQKGASDDCEMLDEEGLLNYCLDQGVIVLGWIHTHPSQDCFLSSMDLHTHLGYQMMIPEAVAIVVAPRDPRMLYAVFRLTDKDPLNGGLALIQRCKLRGFHKHPDGIQIYEMAGHVTLDASPLTIHDMR